MPPAVAAFTIVETMATVRHMNRPGWLFMNQAHKNHFSTEVQGQISTFIM